jgi:hypothetical protein
MDRREAARWQIRQCRKDILLQAITAVAAIVVAAVLLISAAHSETLDIRIGRTPGFQSCAGGTCIHGDLPEVSRPKIIQVPQPTTQAEQDAADRREREWLNVCDPTFRRDSFGVDHYVFKKPGCEYGVPE